MPIYEYRCSTCQSVFDARRSIAEADAPAACPAGHEGAKRLLAVFATIGLAAEPARPGLCGAPVAGGCGAGCACC